MRARAKERDVLGKKETAMRNNNSGVHYPKNAKTSLQVQVSTMSSTMPGGASISSKNSLSVSLAPLSLGRARGGDGEKGLGWKNSQQTNLPTTCQTYILFSKKMYAGS